MPDERLQLSRLSAHRPVALQSRRLPVSKHRSASAARAGRIRPQNVLCRPNGKLFRPDSPLSSVSAWAAFGRIPCTEDTQLPRISPQSEQRIKAFTAIVRREVQRCREPLQIRLDMIQLAHEWGIFVYRAEMIVDQAIAKARRESSRVRKHAAGHPFDEAGRTLHPIPKRDRLPWRFMALTAVIVMLEVLILWYLSR